MRKSDKKMDNNIRIALTDVCETALKQLDGFQWLTHLVNYSDFPESLKIVCVFDSNENLAFCMSQGRTSELASLIQKKLGEIDVNVKNISSQITYDTEENCKNHNNGSWADRLG
ncbi:Fis family transcriptional regulator [Amphritea sp. HPY]|uniref:Fis family transcriptional regulator n=1 Tax=Amphritea sp. HPY TaxID=3421652 RepID=UPI003D7D3410